MHRIFHPLLAMIASSTDSLSAKQVLYLVQENRVLRSRIPGQIHTKPEERAILLKYGKEIGGSIKNLISIVTPGSFYRWLKEEKTSNNVQPKGRPHKSKSLRSLVIKIAKETGFGYTKILGKLRMLGIRKISRQTVKNILKQAGIEPGPKRNQGTWDQYIKQHAETPWACDFFTKKSITRKGIKKLYVLVFIHIKTREVIVTPATEHPNTEWLIERTKEFVDQVAHHDHQPEILLHDGDKKFSFEFRSYLKENGIYPKKLPYRSPNLNAHEERFVQTIKQECLDHFIAFGHKHLDYLVSEFVHYYNNRRPHSSREHLAPQSKDPPEEIETIKLEDYVCREKLGGVIKSFERVAA